MRTRSKYGRPYTRSEIVRYWWEENSDWVLAVGFAGAFMAALVIAAGML